MGPRRERGQGSERGFGEKQRRESRLNTRRERDRGKRRRGKARKSRPGAQQRRHHQREARGRGETCQAITLIRRTYVSGRSTETGFMPIQARIWTEVSVTTQRDRRGGVT